MKKIFTVLIVSMVGLLAGCTSSPKTTHNLEFDFASVKSYSLFPRESKFSELQRMNDFERNRIELALEQQMESIGLEYKELEESDVVVTYFLVGNSLRNLQQYNKGVKACIACTPKEQLALNKEVRTSMLIIDVLDRETKTTVFRGMQKIDLDVEENSEEQNVEVIRVVSEILTLLPIKH